MVAEKVLRPAGTRVARMVAWWESDWGWRDAVLTSMYSDDNARGEAERPDRLGGSTKVRDLLHATASTRARIGHPMYGSKGEIDTVF